jgi:RluA family pseudouridine synthase
VSARHRDRIDRLEVVARGPGWGVVAKPAGLATAGERSCPGRTPLLEAAARSLGAPDVLVVHRLDRGTSGCLVVATEPGTHRALSLAFQERRVGKTYLALVSGIPAAASGTIDAPLERDPRGRGLMRVVRPGAPRALSAGRPKPSSTAWRRLVRFRGCALLEMRPHTGRQHQLRVHLRHIGHPLAVDPQYGSSAPLLLSSIKRGYRPSRRRPEAPLLDRTPLHAWKLTFTCPASGARVQARAPLPPDLRRVVRDLMRYAEPRPGRQD